MVILYLRIFHSFYAVGYWETEVSSTAASINNSKNGAKRYTVYYYCIWSLESVNQCFCFNIDIQK